MEFMNGVATQKVASNGEFTEAIRGKCYLLYKPILLTVS